MSRRGQKKKFKYTIHTKYSSFLTYMQLQTIVTLTYYYYITSYFYILLLRSRLLSENSAPIFEFSSFIHTYFLHCCSSYYYPTPHVLLYLQIVVLQKKNTNSKPNDMFFDLFTSIYYYCFQKGNPWYGSDHALHFGGNANADSRMLI